MFCMLLPYCLAMRQVEFRMIALVGGTRIPIRLVSSNPTGYNLRVDFYVEHRDTINKAPILKSVAGELPGAHAPCTRDSECCVVCFDEDCASRRCLCPCSQQKLALLFSSDSSWGSDCRLSIEHSRMKGYPKCACFCLCPLPAPVSDRGIAGGLSKSGLIGELDGKSILTPYLVTTRFERRRALAATLSDTLYVVDVVAGCCFFSVDHALVRVYLAHLVNQRCSEMLCAAVWGVAFPSADHLRYAYDFLEVFQRALTHQWQEYAESLRRSIPIPQDQPP